MQECLPISRIILILRIIEEGVGEISGDGRRVIEEYDWYIEHGTRADIECVVVGCRGIENLKRRDGRRTAVVTAIENSRYLSHFGKRITMRPRCRRKYFPFLPIFGCCCLWRVGNGPSDHCKRGCRGKSG